jgi:hypothetical protein
MTLLLQQQLQLLLGSAQQPVALSGAALLPLPRTMPGQSRCRGKAAKAANT